MTNFIIHLASNVFIVTLVYSYSKIKKKKFDKFVLLIFLSNLIDIDHLLATPIYDPARCSINFHPLHSWYLFPIYIAGLFLKKYKYIFIGIILHLILDSIDCLI